MKYQLVNQGTKNAMRLQSIGLVQGTPASEIKKGSFLMWNFGSVSVVNEIIHETAKMIVVSTSPKGSDKVFQRKFLKTRLVCILEN